MCYSIEMNYCRFRCICRYARNVVRHFCSLEKPSINVKKSLKVAIVGAPNSGKSTVLNGLVKWNLAAVSAKAHTTQTKLTGILTENNCQLVFLDTPGLISIARGKRHNLEASFHKVPADSFDQASLVIVVMSCTDPNVISGLDMDVFIALHNNMVEKKKSILVLTNIDRMKNKQALLQIVNMATSGIVGGMRSSKPIKKSARKILQDEITSDEVRELLDFQSSSEAEWKIDLNDPNSLLQLEDTILGQKVDSRLKTIIDRSRSRWQATEKDSFSDSNTEPDSSDNPNEANVSKKQPNKTLPAIDIDNRRLAKLKILAFKLQKQRSWTHFDRVFFVDGLTEEGIDDVRNYLFNCAEPVDSWDYSDSIVTDEDPREITRARVRERCLEHLPHVIPFKIEYTVTSWSVAEDNTLHCSVSIACPTKYFAARVTGRGGETIKLIAQEAEMSLEKTFQRNVKLHVAVTLIKPG